MLRTKPRLSYCGLMIVLSNPSRADKVSLLNAGGGRLVNEFLRPQFNIGQVDIRLKEDNSLFLEGTRCILCLGESAAHLYLPQYRENTIGQIRGLISLHNNIPCLASFFAQDAADIKNFEKEFNTEHSGAEDDEGPEDDYGAEKSRQGRTNRKNYAFWLKIDIEKCKRILMEGYTPEQPIEPNYIIYPEEGHAIRVLQNTKNEYLYFDMETDQELNMLCFSFSFSNSTDIFVVPCYTYDYRWSYFNMPFIYKALGIAIKNNILVAHNGHAFDFIVLAFKYRIPIYRVYDTLLAQHRCFPEVEKSLGHTISLWAPYLPYHKDEGGSYNNAEQCKQMWSYCGKDVYSMRICHLAIEKYASKFPGLKESIEQANASIKPYVIMFLQGIRYKQESLDAIMNENDRILTKYLHILKLVTGVEILPTSNPSCCNYFHNLLGYPVLSYGKPSKKDGSRKPSLGKRNIFKLRLKHDNPILDMVIAYRELKKESGALKFNPWKQLSNEINTNLPHR